MRCAKVKKASGAGEWRRSEQVAVGRAVDGRSALRLFNSRTFYWNGQRPENVNKWQLGPARSTRQCRTPGGITITDTKRTCNEKWKAMDLNGFKKNSSVFIEAHLCTKASVFVQVQFISNIIRDDQFKKKVTV